MGSDRENGLEKGSNFPQAQLILTFPGNGGGAGKTPGRLLLLVPSTVLGWGLGRRAGRRWRFAAGVFPGGYCIEGKRRMYIDNPRFWGETLGYGRRLQSAAGLQCVNHPVPEPKLSNAQGSSSGAESDLGELAALFAAHGGEGLSAEVSAELALEVVLNEIVEQACLTTGATGAAIVLLRGGEMVCRASSGVNAPQVGARLGSESGLTAECIKTREVQRCDDAQADPRADAEASRSLGVRSVMIFPLLRKGELAGLLEVFSPRPGAFGDRDEPTLEALAQRILKNLERASEPLILPSSVAKSAAVESRPAEPVLPRATEVEKPWAGSAMGLNLLDGENIPLETARRSARAGFDFFSLALGAVVVVCALLLGTLVGVRLGWRRGAAVRGHVMKSGSGAGFRAQDSAQKVAQSGAGQAGGELGTNADLASATTEAGNAGPADTASRINEKKALGAASKPAAPPAGSSAGL